MVDIVAVDQCPCTDSGSLCRGQGILILSLWATTQVRRPISASPTWKELDKRNYGY